MADPVGDALAANRAAVARAVRDGHGKEMRRLLERTTRDVERRARRAIGAGAGADAFTIVRMATVRALAVDALRSLTGDVQAYVEAEIADFATLGAKNVIEFLKAQERRAAGVVRPLSLESALRFDPVVSGAAASRLRSSATSIERYGRRMVGEIEQTLQRSIAAQRSTEDAIRDLVGIAGAPNAPGVYVRSSYWAERIVRTETLSAYNASAQAALEEEQVHDFPDLKRVIVATFDRRTGEDSIFVHGEIRGIHENFIDGAGREYLYPPARPNDREVLLPWREKWGSLPKALRPRPEEERQAAADAAGGAGGPEETPILVRRETGPKTDIGTFQSGTVFRTKRLETALEAAAAYHVPVVRRVNGRWVKFEAAEK